MGVYLSLMSGIFSGAEARMRTFAKNKVASTPSFPLADLAALLKREYGVNSLDDLLRRQLDLTLNIAHGGITLDKNPDELQRDHIFPKSQLEKAGYGYNMVNHYANFHFLRASDNLNKLDKPPHEWFRKPGSNIPQYSEKDLEERLLTWQDLEPGQFDTMIERRGKKIREKAQQFFGFSEVEFNAFFADKQDKPAEPNWAIIQRLYFLKLIERMEGRGSEIRVQLGLTGGKGETARPNFRLMNVATGESQIYRGDNFEPWHDHTIADFNPDNLSEPYTVEEIKARLNPPL